jgi:hypothetical protein
MMTVIVSGPPSQLVLGNLKFFVPCIPGCEVAIFSCILCYLSFFEYSDFFIDYLLSGVHDAGDASPPE